MAATGGLVDWLVADGRIALLAIVILLLEGVFAYVVLRGGRLGFAANWVSGLSLLGAIYVASAGLGSVLLLACLSAALVSHVFYLSFLRRGR